jgi:hypothetical protein
MNESLLAMARARLLELEAEATALRAYIRAAGGSTWALRNPAQQGEPRPGTKIAGVLNLLREHGELMQSDIARQVGVAQNNLGRTCQALIEKGLVVRTGRGTYKACDKQEAQEKSA